MKEWRERQTEREGKSEASVKTEQQQQKKSQTDVMHYAGLGNRSGSLCDFFVRFFYFSSATVL